LADFAPRQTTPHLPEVGINARVFLSYASVDQPCALAIADTLEAAGISV
jgi:hypothetical protein